MNNFRKFPFFWKFQKGGHDDEREQFNKYVHENFGLQKFNFFGNHVW